MTWPILARPLVGLTAGLGLALAITPFVGRLAIRLGFVNKPTEDRWAQHSTALLGGIGIVASIVLGAPLTILAFSGSTETAAALAANRPAIGLVLSAGLMFVVGLFDDVFKLKPHLKFVAQVVGGAILVMFGGLIPLTAWYPVNAFISVFWFIAITNAVNLLDNMDGVAGGIGAIAAFFLGIVALRDGSWLAAALAWSLSGACLGFLRYNFSPASIFMGDAGALFIGAVLAGLAAMPEGTTRSGSLVSILFVPLIIVAVPILDTALVTVTRAVAGRAFYQGGRDHTTHRLVSLGLTERQTALLLYSFALAGGLISLWLTSLNGITAIAVGGVFLTALALLAAYLGHLRVEYADEPEGSRAVTVLVTNLLYKRRLAEILLDAVLCGLALIASVLLRFDAIPPSEYVIALGRTLPVTIAVQLVALSSLGVYRGRWLYAGLAEVHRILAALAIGCAALMAYVAWRVPEFAAAPGIVFTDLLSSAALILAARLSFRSLRMFQNILRRSGEPVIVYGAGDAGDMALRLMLNNPRLGLTPVCLLDDDPRKHGARIHGVPVVGGIERAEWATQRFDAGQVVITTGSLRPEVLDDLRAITARNDVSLVGLDLDFRRIDAETNLDRRPSAGFRVVTGRTPETVSAALRP